MRKTQLAMVDAAAGQRVVVPPILLPHMRAGGDVDRGVIG